MKELPNKPFIHVINFYFLSGNPGGAGYKESNGRWAIGAKPADNIATYKGNHE